MSRRPRLGVVAHSLTGRPRHIATFHRDHLPGWTEYHVVEYWSEAEWGDLHPAERPKEVSHLEGTGWVELRSVNKDEFDDLNELIRQQRAATQT